MIFHKPWSSCPGYVYILIAHKNWVVSNPCRRRSPTYGTTSTTCWLKHFCLARNTNYPPMVSNPVTAGDLENLPLSMLSTLVILANLVRRKVTVTVIRTVWTQTSHYTMYVRLWWVRARLYMCPRDHWTRKYCYMCLTKWARRRCSADSSLDRVCVSHSCLRLLFISDTKQQRCGWGHSDDPEQVRKLLRFLCWGHALWVKTVILNQSINACTPVQISARGRFT